MGKRSTWQDGCRIGEGVKKAEKVKSRLDAVVNLFRVFLFLTLSENPANIMDVIPAAMLLQKSFYRICPPIIGMAGDKEEALEMVRCLGRCGCTGRLELFRSQNI